MIDKPFYLVEYSKGKFGNMYQQNERDGKVSVFPLKKDNSQVKRPIRTLLNKIKIHGRKDPIQ